MSGKRTRCVEAISLRVLCGRNFGEPAIHLSADHFERIAQIQVRGLDDSLS